jgi:hypothetical protein
MSPHGPAFIHVRHERAVLWGLEVIFFVAATPVQAARARSSSSP